MTPKFVSVIGNQMRRKESAIITMYYCLDFSCGFYLANRFIELKGTQYTKKNDTDRRKQTKKDKRDQRDKRDKVYGFIK